MDIGLLEQALTGAPARLYYAVPNFQNPSGITYDTPTRRAAAAILRRTRTVFVEDDPYGELRFRGSGEPSFATLLEERCVLLGTFSKIVAPALRIGWLVARGELMEKILIAKQASDLHTNYLGQRIIAQYLADNDIDDHIALIRAAYGRQRDAMVAAIRAGFPAGVACTEPEGGMFLWVTLPDGRLLDAPVRPRPRAQGRLCSRRALLRRAVGRQHPEAELLQRRRENNRRRHRAAG